MKGVEGLCERGEISVTGNGDPLVLTSWWLLK